VLEQRLLVLRVVVLGVLGDVAELARGLDPVRDLAALVVREILDLLLKLLLAFRSKDDVLQLASSKKNARRKGAVAGGDVTYRGRRTSTPDPATISR